MRGAWLKSALRIVTLPRLVGLQVAHAGGDRREARAAAAPNASRLSGCTWYWMLACGWLGSLRVKMPSCDGAMLIGPVRLSSVLEPDQRLAEQARGMRVERAHALDLVDRADLQVVLQVGADAGHGRLQPGSDARCSSAGVADARTAAAAAAIRSRRRSAPPRGRHGRCAACRLDQLDAAAARLPVATGLEQQPAHLRAGQHREVRACLRIGRRKALDAFQRQPLRWLTSK